MVGDNDFYGCEINYASKLGEDVGEPGEIYLTEDAYNRFDQLKIKKDKVRIKNL